MTACIRALVLLGCLVAIIGAQIFGEGDIEEEYDGRIHIKNYELSSEAVAAISGLVVGDTQVTNARYIVQSRMLGEGLGEDAGILCPNHTELLVQAVLANEQWALQMIDAIGRQPSALLYDGNFRWLGSWEECLAVEPLAYTDPVNKTGLYTPFEPKYCQAKFTFKQASISKQVTVGMCFPSTCTPGESKPLADALMALLKSPNVTMKARSVTCQETDRELSDKAIAVTVICCLFIALMVFATVYDLFIVMFLNRPAQKQDGIKTGIANALYASTDIDRVETGKLATSDTSSGLSSSGETKLLLPGGNMSPDVTKANAMTYHAVDVRKVAPVEVAEQRVEQYKPGILGRLLLSFSVYTNGSKILDTKQAAGTLTAVNGLRFISMSWVILGHTLAFKGQAPDNYNTWIAKMIKRWPFQAIANATVSVDTFFVLSGLLVAYLSLKEMKKKGGPRKFNWFLYYFHRFWRLTPPYMLVLMVYVPLMGYWADGPIWNPNGIEKNECNETWWHNLLYINNLIDHTSKQQCMGWSWYLANDMQFYIISPLMLVPLYYSKVAGSVVCFALILTNLICTGVISKHYNFYSVQKIDPPRTPGVNRSDMIYVKPYTRIGPYVIGILLGYILYRTNCKVRMRWIWNVLGWAVATTIGLLVIYGPYTSDGTYQMSENEAAFFNAAHRIGWGITVAWVIFACATGYGGPVNKLLSWRGIIPLSRLTYCAYLVHPVVMKTYYNSVRALQHWSDLEFVYQFLSNLVLSMATAFVVSLAFEAPMMGLEKVLLAKYKK